MTFSAAILTLGPGATYWPKFFHSRDLKPWSWAKPQDLEPHPRQNYYCWGDLEPQPGQNFQSPWDLEPQPQAKLLLYWGPGAAARPKFSISLGPRATTPSQNIVERATWSCSPAKIFNLPGTSSHNPKPNYCCTGGPGAAARPKFSI